MNSIITVKNISKKYSITSQQGGYVALRDVLTNVAKSPFSFLKHKAKEAVGKTGKEEFWALKDVNFEVEKGEAIGIIGANGAGKSTLLKILTGITPPTTGEIRMRGKVASLLEVGTGFHPELTGRENIFLNGAILGMTKKEIGVKFNDIVKFSGIEKFIDTPVKRYSSGMYVRLAFSVAAHMEPDILLVDEVLAVGDADFQKKCLGKMDEVTKKAGRTILFVSHNMNAIQNLCKRCILLKDGRVEMIGETKNVIKLYLKKNVKNFKKNYYKHRKGNREIEITNIKLLNKNFKEVNFLITGQECIIAIDYKSKLHKLNDIDFSLSLKDKYGNSVSLLMVSYTQKCFKKLMPKGRIYCKIFKLPLSPGIYSSNVNVLIANNIVDYIFDAIYIEVIDGLFFRNQNRSIIKNHSPLLIEHEWSTK
ncbi:ABC transporter ATP-binding protein [Candidatus Parcubacteria bacterium]|nr:ABC transporter ATP-binding protein [Candidatus Parcubacteria bacterium]